MHTSARAHDSARPQIHATAPGIDPVFFRYLAFGVFALLLLVATMSWHLPMMLWDHLDLVPVYQAWQDGNLASSAFADPHGGHLHASAYAILLATTFLSDGRPWLDCLISWGLLAVHAAIVLRIAASDPRLSAAGPFAWVILALLVLHPGHLANLQWGWQVAVFVCLIGISTTVAILSRTSLDARWNLLALIAAILAWSAFAVGAALLPAAIVLLLLNRTMPLGRRMRLMVPWLMAGVALALWTAATGVGSDAGLPAPWLAVSYLLHFIGSPIVRFAGDLAPWLAAIGLVTGVTVAWLRRDEDLRPWLGLMVFAVMAGVLAAAGRAEAYGAEQALVSRYISFSSLFWVGWWALVAPLLLPRGRVVLRALVAVWVAMLFFNGLHLGKRAMREAERAETVAATIRQQWPAVDDKLLADIYFGQPDVAHERLAVLRRWRFAPFDQER